MSKNANALLLELGSFVAEARCERLPDAIVEKARACLLYGLAVGVAGARSPQAHQAAQAADLESARCDKGATRILDGRELPSTLATFCNAALLHARVQDDSHPAGHFGVVAIPAALASAERLDASGAEMLAALVAGYEVALRIGRDHAADASARGFRTTPLYGVFAAAASAARLMKLDALHCAHALALAASGAGGLREWMGAGSHEQAFQVGMAARNGIAYANLAASGAVAALSALDGATGFFRAYAGGDARYAQRVPVALGEVFEMSTVEYKPYPISQFLRAAVHAVIALRGAAGARAARRIEVRMHPFEADFPGNRYAGPFSGFPQTLTSTPFCAALAWVAGDVTFAGLHAFAQADVLALVARVEVIADGQCARYAPKVAVTLDDDTRLEHEPAAVREDYTLTWDVAVRMNEALGAEVGISRHRSGELRDLVASIERAGSVRPLVRAASACIRAL